MLVERQGLRQVEVAGQALLDAGELEGVPMYPTLASLPEMPEVVNLVVPPASPDATCPTWLAWIYRCDRYFQRQ